jgi:YfiH family protein
MKQHTSNGLKFYTFNNLDEHGVVHAIFTRQGGVSQSPWASLNLGGTVGDSKENIVENRKRMFDVLQLPVNSLHDVWQVHGTKVKFAENPRPLDQPHEKADIIITDKPGITLLMRFADCVPILLFDPIKKVIGIIHAGWVGTVKRIAAIAVDAMKVQYGVNPSNILAGIGPSIGPDHYEVGYEVLQMVKAGFSDKTTSLIKTSNGRSFLDLWKTNELVLQGSGVIKVEVAGLCTACNLSEWYSHRGEKGKTGRFAALISL